MGTNNMTWTNLLQQLSNQCSFELLNDIKKSTTLREKVELCYNTPSVQVALRDWLSSCISRPSNCKSSEMSLKFRQLGNNFCEEKNYPSALRLYNKSLFYSPKDSDEQRAAYGNRSHIMMLMERFQESVKDVDRALKGDSSVLRKVKLLVRRGEALLELGKHEEATEVLKTSATMIHGLKGNEKKKSQKTLNQIEKLLNIMKSKTINKPINNQEATSNDTPQEPNINFTENPDFRYASKYISLLKNDGKGRYVVANNDIKVGDVLFAERPFAFVVLPKMVDKYCNFCCKRMFAPVPCDDCPLACFCDESCKESAWKNFHSFECRGLDVCYSIGIVHLSLRVALLGLLPENKEKYEEVKDLLSHLDDLQPSDLFCYTVTATLLLLYLQNYTNMFSSNISAEKLYDFGGTLLLHIGQLVCNGHAITDIEDGESSYDSSLLIEQQVRVGTAIYPSASMMNHSCRPNIINSFYDTLLIVRATKNLKKGDEVYNCYGPMVYNTEFSKRQELLKSQYFFYCDCDACRNKEGPVSDEFVCRSCCEKMKDINSSFENCSHEVDINDFIEDLNEADFFFNQGNEQVEESHFEEAYQNLSRALKLREKHCHKHHRKLLECRDSLARVCASLGRNEEACNYLIKNIFTIEHIYGELSIEVGQEIMKLLSLGTSLFDRSENFEPNYRRLAEECIEFGKKGEFIFKLSYGEWHPRYIEMKKHLKYLNMFVDVFNYRK